MNLTEHTQIIKHREKSIQLSFWDIGKDLKYIKEKSIFLEKYQNFEDYVVENFTFSLRHAERMMKVATEYERQAVIDVGLTKMYLILQVPEEHRDEIIQEVEEKGLTTKELSKKVKRFKDKSGTPAEHKGDMVFKLVRQFNIIESHYNGNIEFTKDLKEEIGNWIASAEKYSFNEQISKFLTSAIAMREDLK